jgi:hypothetical protein
MDLVRDILLAAEQTPANSFPKIEIPGQDEDAVLEHLELLIEAGLLEGKVRHSGMGGSRILLVHVDRLTWKGHEFLANARNEQVWSKTKAFLKERGGSMSFEIVKALLVKIAAQHFGLTA